MLSQFEYCGVDASGRPVRGRGEGENPLALVLQLKSSGIRTYSLTRVVPPRSLSVSRKISLSELALFNEQLASLLKTKLPLNESLRNVSKEMKNRRLKTVSEQIASQLESGTSFSGSLAAHEREFPPIYRSMIKAGERSGSLAEILFHVASYFRSTDELRRKFIGIFMYPLMLTFLAIAVLVFLIKIMVPPYIEMYSTFTIDFPIILTFLAHAEKLVSPVRMAGLAAGICLVILFFLYVRRSNEDLRVAADRFFLKVPIWGRMITEAVLAQNIATAAILLRGGVPLSEALQLVKDLTPNRPLREVFASAAKDTLEGESLSQNLVKQPLFPLEIAWIIRNGEINGDLIGALEDAANMCRGKFEFSSRLVLSILEPLLLIGIGSIIILIAIMLFYPLYMISGYLGA